MPYRTVTRSVLVGYDADWGSPVVLAGSGTVQIRAPISDGVVTATVQKLDGNATAAANSADRVRKFFEPIATQSNYWDIVKVGDDYYGVDTLREYLLKWDATQSDWARVGNSTRFGVNEGDPTALENVDGTVYMVGAGNDALYTLDLTTGVAARVGNAAQFGVGETAPVGLARVAGTTYLLGQHNDALYTLDLTTGVATRVGNATRFGVGENLPGGIAAVGGTLYLVGHSGNAIYTLNLTNGVATRVSSTANFGYGGFAPVGLANVDGQLISFDALFPTTPSTNAGGGLSLIAIGLFRLFRQLAPPSNRAYQIDHTTGIASHNLFDSDSWENIDFGNSTVHRENFTNDISIRAASVSATATTVDMEAWGPIEGHADVGFDSYQRLTFLPGFQLLNSVIFDNNSTSNNSDATITKDIRETVRYLGDTYAGKLTVNISGTLVNPDDNGNFSDAYLYLYLRGAYRNTSGNIVWLDLSSYLDDTRNPTWIRRSTDSIFGEAASNPGQVKITWNDRDSFAATVYFTTALDAFSLERIAVKAIAYGSANDSAAKSSNWETRTYRDSRLSYRANIEGIGFEKVYSTTYEGLNVISIEGAATERLNGRVDAINGILTNTPENELTFEDLPQARVAEIRSKSNPALWFYESLKGSKRFDTTLIWGANLDDDQIDLDSIREWAEFCHDNEIEFHAFMESERSMHELLQSLLTVGRAFVTFASGKIGVVIDEFNAPIVAELTEADIAYNSMTVSQNIDLPYARISAEFVDKDNDYSVSQISEDIPEGQELGRVQTVQLFGITNVDLARTHLRLIKSRHIHRDRVVSFRVGLKFWHLSKGDVITVRHKLLRRTLTTKIRVPQWDPNSEITLEPATEKRYLKILGTRYISETEMEINGLFDEHDYDKVYGDYRRLPISPTSEENTSLIVDRLFTTSNVEDWSIDKIGNDYYAISSARNYLLKWNNQASEWQRVGNSSNFGISELLPVGLAAIGSKLYAIGRTNKYLFEINSETGVGTRIGTADSYGLITDVQTRMTEFAYVPFRVSDFSWCVAILNGVWYGVISHNRYLSRWDTELNTWVRVGSAGDFGFNSRIVPFGIQVTGMAAISGELFAVATGNVGLFKINTTTGVGTKVGNSLGFGILCYHPAGLALANGKLYSADNRREFLFEIDRTTGVGSRVEASSDRVSKFFQPIRTSVFSWDVIEHANELYGLDNIRDYLLKYNKTTREWERVGNATAFGVGETSPTGLAAIGNTVYLLGNRTAALYTINTNTGIATRVGTTTNFGIGIRNPGTLAAIGNTLYATPSGDAVDYLFTIDRDTGVGTRVGTVDAFGIGTYSPTGLLAIGTTLYAMSGGHYLFTINTTTGIGTRVGTAGNLGANVRHPIGLANIQGQVITFNAGDDRAYEVDTTTGIASRIGGPIRFNIDEGVVGITAVGNKLIAIGRSSAQIYEIDKVEGTGTRIGTSRNLGIGVTRPVGLQYIDNVLLTYSGRTPIEISPTTGIGQEFGVSLRGLASIGSSLYALDDYNSRLVNLSTTTGIATRVGTSDDFGISESDVVGIAAVDNTLYGIGKDTDYLFTISATTGAGTRVGASTNYGITPAPTSPRSLGVVTGKLHTHFTDVNQRYEISTTTGVATLVEVENDNLLPAGVDTPDNYGFYSNRTWRNRDIVDATTANADVAGTQVDAAADWRFALVPDYKDEFIGINANTIASSGRPYYPIVGNQEIIFSREREVANRPNRLQASVGRQHLTGIKGLMIMGTFRPQRNITGTTAQTAEHGDEMTILWVGGYDNSIARTDPPIQMFELKISSEGVLSWSWFKGGTERRQVVNGELEWKADDLNHFGALIDLQPPRLDLGDRLIGVGRGTDKLFEIDTSTGVGTSIGSAGWGISETSPTALAAIGGVLYGFGTTLDYLVRIDPVTGVGVRVGNSTAFGIGITEPKGLAAVNGVLYGVGNGAYLFRIDTSTGVGTRVGNATGFGIGENAPEGLAAMGNVLYCVGSTNDRLFTIDVSDGTGSWVGYTRFGQATIVSAEEADGTVGYFAGSLGSGTGTTITVGGTAYTFREFLIRGATFANAAFRNRLVVSADIGAGYVYEISGGGRTVLVNSGDCEILSGVCTFVLSGQQLTDARAIMAAGNTFTLTVSQQSVESGFGIGENTPTGIAAVGDTLYGVGESLRQLFSINTTTGAGTRIGSAVSFGIGETVPSGLTNLPSHVFLGGHCYFNGSGTGPTASLSTISGDIRGNDMWVYVGSGLKAPVQFGIGERIPTGLSAIVSTLYAVGRSQEYLFVVNTSNGNGTRVGSSTNFGFPAEFDVYELGTVGDTLYGVGNSATESYLFSVDTETGVGTRIGTASNFGIGERRPTGLAAIGSTLYCVGQTNKYLFSIDTETGEGTRIGNVSNFGISELRPRGLAAIGTDLYCVGQTGKFLFRIDTTTGQGTPTSGSITEGLSLFLPNAGTPTDHRYHFVSATIGTMTFAVSQHYNYLIELDTTTGIGTRVGTADQFGIGEASPQGLAAIGNTLYAIGTSGSYLFTIDTNTGIGTRVGTANQFGIGESDPTGLAAIGNTLYAVGSNRDYLFTIDTQTGIGTRVGNATAFGIGEATPQGLAAIGNTLYAVGATGQYLFTIDTNTGIGTRVGTADRFGIGEYIPTGLAAIGNTLILSGNVTGYGVLDTETGIATQPQTRAVEFGIEESRPEGLAAIDNTLYASGRDGDYLFTINTNTGVGTPLVVNTAVSGTTPFFGSFTDLKIAAVKEEDNSEHPSFTEATQVIENYSNGEGTTVTDYLLEINFDD